VLLLLLLLSDIEQEHYQSHVQSLWVIADDFLDTFECEDCWWFILFESFATAESDLFVNLSKLSFLPEPLPSFKTSRNSRV